ncbi:4417_t:CDS:2 [Dentiscutata erythropus]|uniref:4417_t:CDS:1 n=1 Tax=Dentiscutata erythropus TaxID=1348616 RepID=A0A9N8VG86_9GLOM|nr:4417_t:CDS:2 [Dentiscutata erythropus]
MPSLDLRLNILLILIYGGQDGQEIRAQLDVAVLNVSATPNT